MSNGTRYIETSNKERFWPFGIALVVAGVAA